MIRIYKPQENDLESTKKILVQWTKADEVEKYIKRIINEFKGKTEFNLQFWVAKENQQILGIIGLCDPLPKILPLATTDKPGELKILYVDENYQRKGVGKTLVNFLENEAKIQGYTQLMVRSALIYKDTGWGFYDKLNFLRIGQITNEDNEIMQIFSKKLL